MNVEYDAVVIGAGAAGATAAALLAAAGWSVALVERRRFPRRKVCGECIAATNLTLLDALGVGAEIAERAGPPLERVALYAGEEEIEGPLPRAETAPHWWGRALGREHLDTLLAQRAAALGAALWQPWRAAAVSGGPGAYLARLESAEGSAVELRAAVLIDAHGSWERGPAFSCRSGMLPRPPRAPGEAAVAAGCRSYEEEGSRGPSDLFAFKATFAGARLAPGLLPVLALPGGYGGMVIADGGALTIACCIRRDRLQQCRTLLPDVTAGEAVQRWLERSCPGVRRALANAERRGRWLAVGPLRPGARPLWSPAAGFAVGNAAGEAHPILGEGLSMAMQSAWLLCTALGERRAGALGSEEQAAIARRYAVLWRRRFAARMRWAAFCAHVAMRPRAAAALAPLLRRRPQLLTLCARLGGKVSGLPRRGLPFGRLEELRGIR